MNKKKITIVLLAGFLATSLLACGGSANKDMATQEATNEAYDSVEAEYQGSVQVETEVLPEEAGGYGTGSGDASQVDWSQHKIIRTATLSMETKTFTEVVDGVSQKAGELGGYVENSSIQGREPEEWSEDGRFASLTVRIPGENLDVFLSAAKGMARVTEENMQTENVTSQYVDVQARKESLEVQLQSVEEIMRKATKLEDVLTLETEISRLRYEIENLESRLRSWDNLTSMSTVHLQIWEVTEVKALPSQQDSLGERISAAFYRAINTTVDVFQSILVAIVYLSPILILAVIVLIVVLALRRRKKKKGEKVQSADTKPDAEDAK